MTATAEQIARLRRMVNESTSETYTNADLQAYIERYPTLDGLGNSPYVESETTPGTLEINDDWNATYDLNAAAADIWAEKGGKIAVNYDFATQGQSFTRSQAYKACMEQSRYYRSRRAAGTIHARPEPKVPEELLDDDLESLDSDLSN